MMGIVGFINEYKDSPKHIYKWLMDFIGYIIGLTSDQAADIAARSLPIVAPLPNAISVYFVSQSALGFNEWQALALACAIEIAMFAVIEIALIMFDGLLKDERRYRGAFKLSLGVSVGVLILIIMFVVFVEVSHEGGNPVLAGMPLLSGASAIMLALKRWHTRNENEERGEHESAVSGLNQKIKELTSELKSAIEKVSEYAKEIAALKTDAAAKDQLIVRQAQNIEGLSREIELTADTAAKSQSEQIERAKSELSNERDRRSVDAAKYENDIVMLKKSNDDYQREIEKNKSEIMELRIALARSEEQAKVAQKSVQIVRPNNKPEPKSNGKISKDDAFKIILDYCKENPFASLTELRDVTGKGKSTVSEYLTEMEQSKIIHRNGNGVEILRYP